jgi:hypothetical protein
MTIHIWPELFRFKALTHNLDWIKQFQRNKIPKEEVTSVGRLKRGKGVGQIDIRGEELQGQG